MSLERMSVSLDDFLKYLLGKWKFIIVYVLLGVTIAVVSAQALGNAIVIPPSENYSDLKEQEAYFENYIENSITMEMNPMNIFEKTIFIDHISDRNALKDYIDSGRIWEASIQTTPSSFLAELLLWEEQNASQSVELKVQHSEENMCIELTNYLAEQIQAFDGKAEVTIGELKTVIDESVSDVQMWYLNRLQDIQGQLEYTAAGCTIEVSIITAIILGALTGGLISVIVFFFMFLFKDELRSIDEIEYYTKAKLMGKAPEVKEKKSLPEVGSVAFQEELKGLMGKEKRVALVNLTDKELAIDGIEMIYGVESAKEIEKIVSSDIILIAAAANKTIYKEMKKVLSILAENEKEIYGCIAC